MRFAPSPAAGMLVVALLPAACSDAGPRNPNVVVIVADSLRADHLGCYGHERPTSPAIDALAASGVVFERAHATAPWTTPSVATMLTGMHPGRHGVVGLAQKLPDELDSLPEILKRHGYRTGGVVSNLLIGRQAAFDQGFDDFHQDQALGQGTLSTPGVTETALELMREYAAGDEPFFLFVHYFDPHFRYMRHPEYGWASDGAGSLNGGETIQELRRMAGEMTPEEIGFLVDLYDEEIRFMDAGIGALLDELDELGIAGDTVVAFTADHGEEFLAHGWIGHTRTLFQELVRVPLVVRVPGRPGGSRVDAPVSLVGLTPTLLDLAAIRGEGQAFQGRSFAPLVLGGELDHEAVVFAEVDFGEKGERAANKKTIIGERFKLIRDEDTGVIELYDLERDPDEHDDLAAERPAVVEKLLARLDEHVESVERDRIPSERATLSQEEMEELFRLGYLGDGGRTSDG